jgi:phosphatidylglycerol:prolipoprotein diacylglycerol transferase
LSLLALPFPAIDPVLIQVGPFAIRWYALAYIVGIFLGWWYAKTLVRNTAIWGPPGPPMTPLDIDDFVVWCAVGIILGGRVGYVLFYDLPRFMENPLEIFALWHGGMSFHGGFLGTILALLLFARARGIPMLSMLDVAAVVTPIGLFLGRIANFINSELWGRTAADVPWAFVFPNGGPLPRHPSQLYEGTLEGIVLFAILLAMWRKGALKYPGMIGGMFVFGYGIARIVSEFFREPDAHIGYLTGGLTMGMLLSIPMLVVGLGAMWFAKRRGAKKFTPPHAPS